MNRSHELEWKTILINFRYFEKQTPQITAILLIDTWKIQRIILGIMIIIIISSKQDLRLIFLDLFGLLCENLSHTLNLQVDMQPLMR